MPSVQIMDVPDETHRVLRRRATEAHQSLQEYLRSRLEVTSVLRNLELLVTADGRLASASRLRCDIEVLSW